jgi:hypothetical protein
MRLVRAADIARQLGIPLRTMRDICKRDPALAVIRHGAYYIRLDELAKRPGFDLVSAILLRTRRWVKAVDVARARGRSRRNVAFWCRTRQRYAFRLGKIWYVDLDALGEGDGELGNDRNQEGEGFAITRPRKLEPWAPTHTTKN